MLGVWPAVRVAGGFSACEVVVSRVGFIDAAGVRQVDRHRGALVGPVVACMLSRWGSPTGTGNTVLSRRGSAGLQGVKDGGGEGG